MFDEQQTLEALEAGMPLASIERMHAQEVAIAFVSSQAKLGNLLPKPHSPDQLLDRLTAFIDFFDGIPRADMPPPPSGFDCEWLGMHFRSKTERKIAQALERANIAFFPNARGRLGAGPDRRESREPDLLVIDEGKVGVLEVDGDRGHPPDRAAADHARDRLFNRQGIRVVHRFPAGECWEDPDRVVAEFLQLLRLNG